MQQPLIFQLKISITFIKYTMSKILVDWRNFHLGWIQFSENHSNANCMGHKKCDLGVFSLNLLKCGNYHIKTLCTIQDDLKKILWRQFFILYSFYHISNFSQASSLKKKQEVPSQNFFGIVWNCAKCVFVIVTTC